MHWNWLFWDVLWYSLHVAGPTFRHQSEEHLCLEASFGMAWQAIAQNGMSWFIMIHYDLSTNSESFMSWLRWIYAFFLQRYLEKLETGELGPFVARHFAVSGALASLPIFLVSTGLRTLAKWSAAYILHLWGVLRIIICWKKTGYVSG